MRPTLAAASVWALRGMLVLAAASFAWPAGAKPTSQDKAVAESLFREAKKLAKKGKLDDACPKFEESHRLDPQLGTLLHLATCHEQQGKTASAWAEYSAAAELAAERGDRREKLARKRAKALEAGLSRLTLKRDKRAEPDEVTIELDGKPLGDVTIGTPIPIDPGEHEITVKADGYRSSRHAIDVQIGDRLTLAIGSLERRSEDAPPDPDPETPARAEESAQPLVGWVTFGIGGAVLIGGLALGGAAAAQRDAADEECDGRFCSDDGLAMHDTSRDFATASTVLVVVGALGVVAGITVVLTAPDSEEQASVFISPTGIAVGGVF